MNHVAYTTDDTMNSKIFLVHRILSVNGVVMMTVMYMTDHNHLNIYKYLPGRHRYPTAVAHPTHVYYNVRFFDVVRQKLHILKMGEKEK